MMHRYFWLWFLAGNAVILTFAIRSIRRASAFNESGEDMMGDTLAGVVLVLAAIVFSGASLVSHLLK
jgi:hypothetical protein